MKYSKNTKTGNTDYAVFPAIVQQMTGIEPAFPAWEAGVLPMNYICICHAMNYNAIPAKMQGLLNGGPHEN